MAKRTTILLDLSLDKVSYCTKYFLRFLLYSRRLVQFERKLRNEIFNVMIYLVIASWVWKIPSILFVVALLILGWFGAEVFTAQNICVTTCMDLSGLTRWEQVIAVVFLPAILVIGGFRARRNEKGSSGAAVSKKQQ